METSAGQTDLQNGNLARPRSDEPARPVTREDPFTYLPFSKISRYRRYEPIYTPSQPASSVYLVVEGKVKVLRHESLSVVVDIYRPDEFFGESVLAGQAHRLEQAVAIEPTTVMSWPLEEIEKIAALRPEFALALVRLVVRRSIEFANRIESFSIEGIEQRLKRALVRLAGRFGSECGDGTVKMDAFTHGFLSQYVGTSREVVTQHMTRLRREGYLQYSRREISLHPHTLTAWRAAQSPRLGESAALTN
jgi:CRP-like cAMP-binding protein